MNKLLEEIEENISKQVKNMNNTVQDLRREMRAIKKMQTEAILEIENLREREQELQMQASTTEYKRWKRVNQV